MPVPAGQRICYAPDAAFAREGTLYITFVTLRGAGNVPNAVWLAEFTDGGKTLGRPRRVLGKLAFQVRLVTDPTDSRRLYMTCVQGFEGGLYSFGRSGNPIRTMRSDDGGASWRRPVQINDAVHQRALVPASAVSPQGHPYVLYLDLGDDRLDYEGAHMGRGGPPYAGHWRLVLARSTDRGETWERPNVDERIVPTERIVAFIPPFPSLAIDRNGRRIYVGFEDARLGDPDVWIWSLRSGGEGWEGPVRVNDTPRRDRTAQYQAKLDLAPNGRLDVLYYDRRADPRNVKNEVSFQSSFDHGESFTSRLTLSDGRFSSRVGFGFERDLPDIGSRLALESADSRALAAWSDTRLGTTLTKKQNIVETAVAFSDSELGNPTEALLRLGGTALALLGVALLAFGLRSRARGPGSAK